MTYLLNSNIWLEVIFEHPKRFRLDFDDAYQYIAAEKHNLTLVSFDADFDRTERGRETPADVLKGLQESPGNGEVPK